MDQINFFDSLPELTPSLHFPLSHDDVISYLNQFVSDGESDDDLFSWSETKNGMSYSIYGTKVFEHIPGDIKKARLKIITDNSKTITHSAATFSGEQIYEFFQSLKQKKKKIFRSIITETFACCNDFMKCSDALSCIHSDDRFYNGCEYRKNLESGKVFYGQNKNI